MWRVMKVTDGGIEEIGVADSGVWPGSILTIEAETYEVLLSEESDADGWVYVTHTLIPRA
jgi:hypothetical protein